MNTILGLAHGEFKSVACAYGPKTQETLHEIIATDLARTSRPLNRLPPDLVVFEASRKSRLSRRHLH